MICPECRHDNIEGVDYCENCGQDLRGLDQPDSGLESGPGFLHERLSDLHHEPMVAVRPSDPVGLAVRVMQNEGRTCILVMERGELLGIITPFDILQKVAGPREDLNAVTCAQVMTADPVCVRDEDDIAVALNKMSIGAFRHLPLLQDGRPIATIGIDAVFQRIAPFLA
ncbi:MAG TPA: CBS domain-containing protein [Dehalococcoidia bacterium]|nr:CBS domain-containing protein [Dehalococcoidia bacterium]